MDSFEFVLCVMIIAVCWFLIWSWIRMKKGIADAKLAEELRVSAERRKMQALKVKASRIEESGTSDLSPWVIELLNSFGVSPDVLFQDQMPPELTKLLPLAKGFVQSGGIQKLLGSIKSDGSTGNEEVRQAI